MIKEKVVDTGLIVYRTPKCSEVFGLLGKLGLKIDDLTKLDKIDQMDFMGKLVSILGDYITEVDIKQNDKTLTSFDELNDSLEYLPLLTEIGMDILNSTDIGQKKSIKLKK